MQIYIDRSTGTWGIAHDLVVMDVPEEEANKLEEMSDSEIIERAYAWEEHGVAAKRVTGS